MMDILEYVLLAFLIFCAVAATLSRRLLITVIIYMAFSLIMSVIWIMRKTAIGRYFC